MFIFAYIAPVMIQGADNNKLSTYSRPYICIYRRREERRWMVALLKIGQFDPCHGCAQSYFLGSLGVTDGRRRALSSAYKGRLGGHRVARLCAHSVYGVEFPVVSRKPPFGPLNQSCSIATHLGLFVPLYE